MQIESIELTKLLDHPANANVMDERLLAKLKGQIRRTGRYEPLVVRVHPDETGCYQLINGHHRRQVLTQLGYASAECVVWPLSDAEALLLLATINRIGGSDDLAKRAKLLARLQREIGDNELIRALPETREKLAKVLALNQPALPVAPQDLALPLEAMTFFVTKAQKATIVAALTKMKPGAGSKRSEQLTALAQTVLEPSLSPRRRPGSIDPTVR